MKKKIFLISVFSYLLFNCFSEISFDNLNLNEQNELLYSVVKKESDNTKYSTLFLQTIQNNKNLKNGLQSPPQILTCYPEKMSLVDNGKKIQITNSFGNAIYDFSKKSLDWKSFDKIDNELSLVQPCYSPDSKFVAYFKKIAASKAQIIIQELATKKSFVLDKEADFVLSNGWDSSVPLKWSSDSKNFIYQKNNTLYLCNVESLVNNLLVEEKYRKIGSGKINCVQWVTSESFAYIDFDIVYLFRAKDFSSLGIFSNVFSIGKVIGRLSSSYEIENSNFWINSSATEILVIKNNSLFFYYKVNQNNLSNSLTLLNAEVYNKAFDSSINTQVFWTDKSKPIIFSTFVDVNSKITNCAYSFDDKNKLIVLNSKEPIKDCKTKATFSPNGKLFCCAVNNLIYIYNVYDWSLVEELKTEKVVSLLFIDDFQLCIGGIETVSLYNVNEKTFSVLFLSDAQNATWDKTSKNIIAKSQKHDSFFIYNSALNTWQKTQSADPIPVQVQNKNFRVYKAKSANVKFANGIYVRNLSKETNTFALHKEVLLKNQKQKKISIVFDLIDNASGINEIIALTEKYNLHVTYFVNGEFIRRYPEEVKKISLVNAEVGSMFYSKIDLTTKEFDITSDYVKRGLARNEDEYFECTGKELSLLWHAPFYKSSKLVRDAGSAAGYSYIDFPTEIDFFDSKAGKVLESQIIPITVGLATNDQRKNFYNKLELLIISLLEANYEIVPVSEL